MKFKDYTKEDLVQMLKELTMDNIDYPESHGAMCYEPSAPYFTEISCELCKKQFSETGVITNVYFVHARGMHQIRRILKVEN